MSSKETKAALKEAREAIKNKEFTTSLKLCKSILKSDRDNYMALVFLGISLQEVGPKDQALHAFRKAITANDTQPLAWHGLMNYYEKESPKTPELLEVYGKVLEFETDTAKFSDLCSKYVNLSIDLQEVSKTSEVLNKLTENENISEQNSRTLWLALASLFTQTHNLQPQYMEMFEKTLKMVIKESTSVTCDYYKEYLKLLYKLKKYSELFNEAKNMHSMYEASSYPLEWICKIYVELVIEENELAKDFEREIEIHLEKLIKVQTDSVMAIFTKGVIAYNKNEYITARDYLLQAVEIRSGMVHAWVLLSECWLKIKVYNDALNAALKADKILQTTFREKLRPKVDKIIISSLSRHENEKKWLEAIEFSKKLQDDDDDDILESLVHANINLKNYDESRRLISKISNDKSLLLKAKLLQHQGNLKEALDLLLKDNNETCEVYLEIGILYWKLKEYNKCLVPFLKAAKLDPNSFESFVCLGRYYEHIKDIEKARRCYQKAHKINPRCSDAGIGLSNIYRKQKNWDANLALLFSCTGKDKTEGLSIINSDVLWAWLQLGLHYLECCEYNKSVDCFCSIIRVEPNNSHYWECLGDAYLARGSYISAMKSYERSAELTQDNLYSKLQIASIKLLIRHYPEAKIDFEGILVHDKRYVPALKGIAETCLNIAYNQQKEQLLGLCRSNAQMAVDYLTTALRERGDFSCLWKLFADCCNLVANLPEKYCCMVVHSDLSENKEKNDYDILDRNKLFTLATRCYCKAITLIPNNITLWYDLAICYFSNACHSEDFQESYSLLEQALSIAKYCVQNEPLSSIFWNFIGVINAHKNVKNFSYAQHAFIKAVTLDKNNAMAWCNLGALYHLLEDIPLANKCYSHAQRSDPVYANSWIGQAIIAETMGHIDAMDLFRHSNQLRFNSESAINYASWVCQTILESPKNMNNYSIKNMHAIPVAWDAMMWYTENNPNDPCAWNMLGILSERLGLKLTATKAYKTSLSLLNSNERDKVLVNYGRMLVGKGKYKEAIEVYKDIKETNFNAGCALALALFKAEEYQSSYESYETAMQWLTENKITQSQVLVALAAMAYKFKGPENAKPLLFQSTLMNPRSNWCLYATLAFGLLNRELNIAQLVLKELLPIKDEPDVIYHNALLDTYTQWIQGDRQKSIRCLTKYIHRHPGEASLWLAFTNLLLNIDFKRFSKTAAHCAEVVMHLGRTQMDVTKVWCLVAFSSLLSLDINKSIKAAQKAIYYYPNVSEGWALLLSALSLSSYLENEWKDKRKWVTSRIKFLKNCPNNSDGLNVWLSRISM